MSTPNNKTHEPSRRSRTEQGYPSYEYEIIKIPDGEYLLKFTGWYTGLYFNGQPKLVLNFTIAEYGPYFEYPLQRFYNVRRLIGKHGKNGRFLVSRSSHFVRDFARVSPRPISRLDRIPVSALEEHLIIGKIALVNKGHDQRIIPETAQYSVVTELLRAEY